MQTERSTTSSPETYRIIRLHYRDENSWAVVAEGTGAILVENRRLMMRLSREDAAKIAESATQLSRFAFPDRSDRKLDA